ncbi:MAG: hypothetical protein ACREM6_03065 [Vulcanimicrobiaceae bacterium]
MSRTNWSHDDLTALEPEQRTTATRPPLPRRTLDSRTVVLLTVLRVYVLVAIPLVVYAFIRALNP